MVLGGGIMNLTKHYYLATVVSRPNHGSGLTHYLTY